MKAAFFTILLLLAPNYSDASCVEVAPFQSIGALKIGDPAPEKKIGAHKITMDNWTADHRWFTAGAYRFRKDDAGKIDIIQFDPGKKFCYLIAGKRITNFTTIEALSPLFPNCQLVSGMPSNWLQCDGLSFHYGEPRKFGDPPTLRIDADKRSLHQIRTEDAARRAQSALLQEWPFRQGFPLQMAP